MEGADFGAVSGRQFEVVEIESVLRLDPATHVAFAEVDARSLPNAGGVHDLRGVTLVPRVVQGVGFVVRIELHRERQRTESPGVA